VRRKRTLKNADSKGVEGLRLGRYPFAAATNFYLQSRKGTIADSTYTEDERKLRYLGSVLEKLKKDGLITTTDPRIMGRNRIGSLLVMRDDHPLGIFTERDLLTTFIARDRPLDAPVSMASSSPLITAPAGISIHAAAKTMASRHIRRLILLKKKTLEGIITARDLVEAYAR